MNGCSGECDQGRKTCKTPQACFIPEEDLETKFDWEPIVAIALTIAMAVGWMIWR